MSEVKEEEGLGNHLLEAQNEQVDRVADGEGSDLRTVKNGENGLIKEEYELEINNASVPLDIPTDHGGVFVQIETPDDPDSSKDCGNGIPVAVRNQSFGKENGEEGYHMGHESNGFPAVKPEIVDGLAELQHEIGEGLIDDIQTAGNVGETVELKENGFSEMSLKKETGEGYPFNTDLSNHRQFLEGDESGTEEEQAAFTRELERFFKERSMEFKPPKFYGEGLNCLKLWRAVTRLGGYDQVTSCKLWRQVGESFKPPKTCTTISWSFRIFYEKALLDYERHKMHDGELPVSVSSLPGPSMPVAAENPLGANQASGSGRARRDAAARAMQGWHSQRLLGNGEVGDPIIKDKSSVSLPKREKQLKSLGLLKRKKPSNLERAVKAARTKATKPHMETMVVDVGPSADWVKINVRRTKDCFEIYALVPGLLREEVRVQSDPAGRLVISGEPEQPDNPWGVTPFKKVVSLPSRIDPHQTSAVVTLHGQLFVRAPFEQLDL